MNSREQKLVYMHRPGRFRRTYVDIGSPVGALPFAIVHPLNAILRAGLLLFLRLLLRQLYLLFVGGIRDNRGFASWLIHLIVRPPFSFAVGRCRLAVWTRVILKRGCRR